MCVLPRSVLAESPGDRKAGQIQKFYTPALSPPGHISWKNTPDKNSSPPQPGREDALGAALGVRLWEVAIMSPGICHAVLASTGGTPSPHPCHTYANLHLHGSPIQSLLPPPGGSPCALLGLSGQDAVRERAAGDGWGVKPGNLLTKQRARVSRSEGWICASGCVTGPQPQAH